MAEIDEPGARGDALPKLFDEGFGRLDGQGNGLADIFYAAVLAQELPGLIAGAVFVVAGQHLVAGLKGRAGAADQGAGDDVDAMRGVGDEDQVGGGGVEVNAQGLAGLLLQGCQFTPQEEHRLVFQAALPGLVNFENREGAGAEGAVVKEMDGGIEQE